MSLSISPLFGRRVRRVATLAALGMMGCAAPATWAAVLYDPGLATLPSAQGWTTAGFGPYTEAVSGGPDPHYQFNTLATNATHAGSARTGDAALDTVAGYTLDFNLRVVSEVHSKPNRAGFSFIVTGLDPAHSIELAFWGNHVWAYTASFAHGVDVAFDTSAMHDYALVVANNSYALSADGSALFSAPLVDYRARGAPYTQPGFLFFGDDTSSASAQVELGAIALTPALAPVPEPATLALVGAGLLGLAWRTRTARPASQS